MSVIIVGGGMVGATLALAISQLSHGTLPVHLIEATAPEADGHPGFDARAIALAAGTCQQLARIGVWQAIADCATAITTVHVSDRGHAGFVTLDADDYRLPALGQVVELHEVGLRLFSLLRKAPGVTLHCPQRVASVARTQEQVSVTLESGETLSANLLVAADGTRSALASACGIDWQQEPYEQLAVIANVATSVAHHGRAFERFTAHGPLAMLPMSAGRCSLVWCHPRDKRDEILAWSDERFCRELQAAFGWRLGRITQAGKRSAYPLALTTAAKAFTHRTVLVGNAAQTLHPIAGQGFNLGLRDVMSLAETLMQVHALKRDVGDYSVLSAYQQRRQEDRNATIGVTDGLVHLFANRWAPLLVGRNVGLMAMELFPPARDALAKRTLGWVAR
ncbi:2-octaprenyl-6-methoxyphenyl hydroxylase [Citrobacter rodentium]|uniref:2-octaprenyl-6-methoxyphenol hydroxylase n=2 Tax=Citrobacter rodentium TaxID=67825 RepID=D2TS09_CITRI|nr:2-octaprenyl-6-methoxyphenyl hydroxylase [Citrobacter rodentium]KIQ50575.1 2-octaprenyl-6-methoxyphenyl hydroxylase [Citrobacter rodentium]QBY31122.1 2-octaprenyl-6-methoxyphenyl hydroxylase [Citrobacter rodentium]UHO31509.1 2-octaprenyl-6-methoxyphenyl hydroxylase [Citrobacter rodentium NBRC 105723 = DSM 16636]CBG91608.1 2-octaprenyl-6-methoxyphenol hydroxylase [Citrobacter rodentium ICC168]HAT8012381.1 2-octaprenyl-6-methoxyphenyl hydroxylase [Citrobacter rodentium NBRC 105723 = DSM 16636